MLLMSFQRAVNGAFGHDRLTFALMTKRTDIFNCVASGTRHIFRGNLSAAHGPPDARVKVDDGATCPFQNLAHIMRLLFLGILRDDQQDIRT